MILIAILATLALGLVPLRADATAAVTLEPCTLPGDIRARCGRLTVLENRALPGDRTISIRIAVIPARDGGSDADPVVYLTGGPGGSAIADAAGIATLFAAANGTRDIVLVDQRGTGGSGKIECAAPTTALRDASAIKAYVRSCVANLDADPRQYTTAPAMDDLGDVLVALGYTTVNLYGVSYGATAAQYFIAQHPELVRTAILDGATLLDVPIFELWGRNGDRALRAILARCAASQRCSRAYPRVRREAFEVIAALRRKPLRIRGTTLDAASVAGAFQALSRTPATAARIPWAAHRARLGDWLPLELSIDELGTGGMATRLVMFWSTVCSEPWASWSPSRTAAASRGTYLAERTALDASLAAATCSALPKSPPPPWSREQVRSETPVLFVAGGADPQDPPSSIAGAISSLPNSRTVVIPAGGHVTLQLGCARRLAQTFVERGTARGLDTRCAARYTPPPFVVR